MGRVAKYKRIKAIDPFAKKKAGRGTAPKQNKRRQASHGQDTWDDTDMLSSFFRGEDGDDVPASEEHQKMLEVLKKLKRDPKESLSTFNRRVDMTMADEVARSARRGQKTAQKRHEHLKQKKKEKKRGGAVEGDDANDVLDATARAHGGAPTAAAREVKDESDYFRKDVVRFNEVAQEPPQFTAVARKASGLGDAGKRRAKNLQLAAKLPASSIKARPGKDQKTKAAKVAPARQAMLEAERERAVEAYRALKRRQSGAPLAEALARMEERGPM